MTTPARRLREARRYYHTWPAEYLLVKAIRTVTRLIAMHEEYKEKTGEDLYGPTFVRLLRLFAGVKHD